MPPVPPVDEAEETAVDVEVDVELEEDAGELDVVVVVSLGEDDEDAGGVMLGGVVTHFLLI